MCVIIFIRVLVTTWNYQISNEFGSKLKLIIKKQLIGTFNRPPKSNNIIISTVEDSIGIAFDTNIKNILITGNFNLDTLKQISNRQNLDLCQHYNLEQLTNEPTNFTETSSTIIDLFLLLIKTIFYYVELATHFSTSM